MDRVGAAGVGQAAAQLVDHVDADQDPKLAPFTLVTASYRLGALAGVIGVMGPTRMPYDKIVALVDHTSRLVGELLE